MNHWRKWAMAVLGGVALAAALALVAAGDSLGREALALAQDTIYVDADAMGANNGSSWDNAYTTLQPALDEAVAGDEIWVAEGTYKPTYQYDPTKPRALSFQLKNGVALYGGFDPSTGDIEFGDRDWVTNATILSGDLGIPGNPTDNSYHVFYHPAELALDPTAVLDGFTITGGKANGGGVYSEGGGMYNEGCSPTVTHCTFVANDANVGGGMGNYASSSPSLTDCTFLENTAGSIGGGMANYSSSPSLINCTFAGNTTGGNGGAMLNDHSSPEVTGCTFSDNEALSGGAMYNFTGSSPIVTDSAFMNNRANLQSGNGGAIRNHSAPTPAYINCTFLGNSARFGGAIWNGYSSALTATNCTFSGNSAPTGAGIYNTNASVAATNCILWGDTPVEIEYNVSVPVVTYSDVQGGYTGTGNIDLDPLFEEPAMGDIHLLPESPCIDAGSNAAPSLPDYDFEGDPRIYDGDGDGTARADMGADEVAYHSVFLHVAGNGSGTVEQTPLGDRLAHMTVVTLTATAGTGSSFTGWSGDAGGTTNPITLTMDADKAVTATFSTYRVYLPLVVRDAP